MKAVFLSFLPRTPILSFSAIQSARANDVAEIKIRAEKRMGEMLLETERQTPGEYKKTKLSHDATVSPKLKDLGINKSQSSRWQATAQIPDEDFENHITETKQSNKELTSASVLKIAKKQKQEKKRQEYNTRVENAQHNKEIDVAPNLILIDPPWRYRHSKTDSRKIENHYNTEPNEEIITHLPETEDNCIMFLWATAPKVSEAIHLMENWGFDYRTCAVWDKEIIGMGYWFRGQHELLLVGVKGDVSPPLEDFRVSSVFREKRTEHSKKPECVYEWIESAFGDKIKLEMYSRSLRDGWQSWGNEV